MSGLALYLVFGSMGIVELAIGALFLGLAGLIGMVVKEVRSATAESRLLQYGLADIFWLVFLIPASYFVTFGFKLPEKLPNLVVLVAVSFLAKRKFERIGPPRAAAQRAEVHPLDE